MNEFWFGFYVESLVGAMLGTLGMALYLTVILDGENPEREPQRSVFMSVGDNLVMQQGSTLTEPDSKRRPMKGEK